jgi:signal transduction histidine kinase
METRTPVDSVNLRLVLLGYAGIAGLAGFLLLVDPTPVAELLRVSANGTFSLIFVAGAALGGAGLTAIGFASIDSPVDRRRALGWFVAGHFVVATMLVMQREAVWPAGTADWIVGSSLMAAFLLLYTWATAFGDPPWWHPRATTLFGSESASAGDRLRSQFEQQIRLAAAQEERHRLARDLHDSIKQQIFAIQAAAATAEVRLNTDASGARQAIDAVRASAREAMAEMEAMTDQLRAAPLENSGLVAALRKQAEALAFRTGATVDVAIGALPRNEWLSPGTQQTVFRVAQEAFANIARHARATRVHVSLEATAGTLLLVIADDGAGYDAHAAAGSGIDNMRARAGEVRGRFDISRGPAGGTVVKLAVPYVEESAQEFVRRAVPMAAVLAILGVLALLRPSHVGWSWWPLLIPAFQLFRYVNAWRRTRAIQQHPA